MLINDEISKTCSTNYGYGVQNKKSLDYIIMII